MLGKIGIEVVSAALVLVQTEVKIEAEVVVVLELVAAAQVEVPLVELAAEIVSAAELEVDVFPAELAGRNLVSVPVTPSTPPVLAVLVAVVVHNLSAVLSDFRIASQLPVQYFETEQELVARK